MAKTAVIGAGSWGTALSLVLHTNGNDVTVWSIVEQEVQMLREKHEHVDKLPGVKLPEDITFTTDLKEAIEGKDYLILAVPSVFTRSTAKSMAPFVKKGQVIVCVAKGIEENTLMTLSDIVEQEIPAADVAVMNYAFQIGQEVHLSTQLNISNAEALKFYAQFADVVVLARELNLEQVAEIYRQIQEEHICGPSGEQIRIEMFCHGALCMAVSGKCYLSLHEMNHSANRGACMQVCRRSYTVRDKETDVELDIDNEYIMSPKDLKTIHFMNKMLDAGVRVFKIEGRARGPEYVRTVVECYKEAIKAYLEGTFTDEKITAWDERLKTVFNRGFWDGYYLGQRLGEWTRNYGSAATERKIYVGKGIKYFSNIGVSEFLVEAAEVSVGDKLLITGPTTGALFMTLEEARVDLESVQTVKKGQHFSMKSDKIRPSDKLYKLVSTEELKKFKGLDIEQKRG